MAFDDKGQLSVDAMVLGLRTAWSALTSLGIKVIVIADTPHPGSNVYSCVHQHRDRVSVCAYSRDRYASSAAPTQHLAARGQRGVRVIDLFDAICPTERCASVVGNVLIYRQGSHLTKTYVETLTPRLAEALSNAGLAADF
jgi:hypothetical protein